MPCVTRQNRPEYQLGLRLLTKNGTATLKDLQTELGLSQTSVRLYVGLWRKHEGLRVVRWQQNPGSTSPTPVFGFAAEDAPCVRVCARNQPRAERPEYSTGLQFIREGEGVTPKEIIAVTGIHPKVFWKYVALWRERDSVRVIDWRQNLGSGGALSPVYAVAKRDAKKPEYDKGASIAASRKRAQQNNRMVLAIKRRAARGTNNMFAQLAIANSGR